MDEPLPDYEVVQQVVSFYGHTVSEALQKATAWAAAQDPQDTEFTIRVIFDPDDMSSGGGWTAMVTGDYAHITLVSVLRNVRGAK